jgi:hypothetical protein
MTDLADSFFGSIALKNAVLSPAELEVALREQEARAAAGRPATLGEVCRALGLLSEEEVNAILWAQAKSEVLLEDALLGKIALKNGLVTRGDLDAALAEQKRRGAGARLGRILIEQGKLSEQQLGAILKTQTRLKESARLKPVIAAPARPTIEPPVRKCAAAPDAHAPARKKRRKKGS